MDSQKTLDESIWSLLSKINPENWNDQDVKDVKEFVLERTKSLEAEVKRLTDAMRHIAAGNISPSIAYAEKILDGLDSREAHRAARAEREAHRAARADYEKRHND